MSSLKLRLDPWATEYNTAYYAEDVPLEEKVNVDTGLESSDWQAIRAADCPPAHYERLLFTDGTRRVEARLLVEDERQQVAFGVLGSFGIGVVDCCSAGSRNAEFMDLDYINIEAINRVCAIGNGRSFESFEIASAVSHRLGTLSYRVQTSDQRDPDAVARTIQFEMLKAEGVLARRLLDSFPESLVVTDGPLPRMGFVENMVGYVKTIHQINITEKEMAVVRSLQEGERSPLYLVTGKDKSQQRFECFLRLRDPNPWLYSLAGMVRLQVYAGVKPEERLDEVCSLMNWLAHVLPRFASKQHQDPRAPQQLLPIRALEKDLGRRMGNAAITRRRIMSHLQLSV